MLCPRCGFFTEDEVTVCPECGETLIEETEGQLAGAQAIRQGKKAREAVGKKPEPRPEPAARIRRAGASRAAADLPPVAEAEEDAAGNPEEPSFERRRRSAYMEDTPSDAAVPVAKPPENTGMNPVHMVNWVRVWIILLAAVMVLAAAGWVVIEKTEWGQKIKARFGLESTSTAYWSIGEERMEKGDIQRAIRDFETARKLDAENGIIDVDGLLMLGNALEADGRVDDAAVLYEEIYTETPSRAEAYSHHIRILQSRKNPGDMKKAGELMRLAYEKTGDASFRTQRSDLLPAPPETDLTAGFYEAKKNIALTSYQGYDVYFTFDPEAKLPEDGTKFTERIPLDEGTHNLRAVAVNGELVSDELRATYKIILPSPQTPRCNLAPNTYKTRQKVRLKPGQENENDDDIIIYYTVDGSNPDRDSPIFTGDPIQLPSGWVILKAVAVNRHRKVSNQLEVKYYIEAKPFPKSAFTADDVPASMKLNYVTLTDFEKTYGEGTPAGTVELEGFDSECRRFDYPWGYAVMTLSRKSWVLVKISITDAGEIKGPRDTKLGDSESYVVGQFCDMMQLESDSGNRGLYSNSKGTGKIWKQEDGTKIIRYRYAASESQWWELDYTVSASDKVTAIDLYFVP